MLGRTDSRATAGTLLCFLGRFAAALTLRLAYWQIGQGDELRTRRRPAAGQSGRSTDADAARSLDSSGIRPRHDGLSRPLAAYPDLMTARTSPKIARRLGKILGLNGQQVDDLISTFDAAPQYTVVARRLTVDQSDQVRDGLRGGELAAARARAPCRCASTPTRRLSRHDAGQPAAGLRHPGRPGSLRRRAGEPGSPCRRGRCYGRSRSDLSRRSALPQTGGSVQLTIDASLQLRLEKELYAAWVADQAPRVTGARHGSRTRARSWPGRRSRATTRTITSARPQDAPELFRRPDRQPGLRARDR